MILIALLMLALSWFLWRFGATGYFTVFVGAVVIIIMWAMK